ncbi:hypothetical protein ACWEPC_05165 [Nonomuraea sp. NPDC004297]
MPWPPKPLTPGAPITWTHYFPDGHTTVRTGTIVDRAPSVPATRTRSGLVMAWWVIPDAPLSSDLYKILAVGKAGARSTAVHGEYLDSAGHCQFATKGTLFASNHTQSPTGRLVIRAVKKIRSGQVFGERA